jgi:glutamate synthase (NADH)
MVKSHANFILIYLYRGINEGRQAAREVDLYLEHATNLPVTGGIVKHSAHEILSSVKATASVAA